MLLGSMSRRLKISKMWWNENYKRWLNHANTHILLTFSSNCAIWLEVEGGDGVEQLHWGGVAFSMRQQNRLVKRCWRQMTKTIMKSIIMTTMIKETGREKKLIIKLRLVLWVTEWGGDDLHEMCWNLKEEEGLRGAKRFISLWSKEELKEVWKEID